MPGYDRTGPQGRGPFSGRGRGFCKRRSSFKNSFNYQNEKEYLKQELKELELEKKALQDRLNNL